MPSERGFFAPLTLLFGGALCLGCLGAVTTGSFAVLGGLFLHFGWTLTAVALLVAASLTFFAYLVQRRRRNSDG